MINPVDASRLRDIQDGYYASRDGDIYSSKYGRLRRLKGKVSKGGYRYVGLRRHGRNRSVTVHSIIAAAFIGPRRDKMEINHVDGNKLNNSVSNLEYVTSMENKRHAINMGLLPAGSRHWAAKLNESDVREIRSLFGSGARKSALARRYGVDPCTIRDVLNGTCWRAS